LATLFLLNPDPKPLYQIMHHHRRWFYAYQEMVNRIQKLKLGHKVAKASWGPGDNFTTPLTPLMASLKTHPRLKGLMRRKDLKQKAYDIKEEAEMRVYGRYKEITGDAARLMETSGVPRKLPKNRIELWALLNPILLELQLRDFFKHYLPVLQGEYEKFSATVYESVRWWVEKLEREEGESLTSQYEDAESGDTNEGESREIQKKMAREYFEQENSATEMLEADVSHRISMVLDWSEKHLNEKGSRYVVARVVYGKTVTDASGDAGVTRQMGHRYELQLKRYFSPKGNTEK